MDGFLMDANDSEDPTNNNNGDSELNDLDIGVLEANQSPSNDLQLDDQNDFDLFMDNPDLSNNTNNIGDSNAEEQLGNNDNDLLSQSMINDDSNIFLNDQNDSLFDNSNDPDIELAINDSNINEDKEDNMDIIKDIKDDISKENTKSDTNEESGDGAGDDDEDDEDLFGENDAEGENNGEGENAVEEENSNFANTNETTTETELVNKPIEKISLKDTDRPNVDIGAYSQVNENIKSNEVDKLNVGSDLGKDDKPKEDLKPDTGASHEEESKPKVDTTLEKNLDPNEINKTNNESDVNMEATNEADTNKNGVATLADKPNKITNTEITETTETTGKDNIITKEQTNEEQKNEEQKDEEQKDEEQKDEEQKNNEQKNENSNVNTSTQETIKSDTNATLPPVERTTIDQTSNGQNTTDQNSNTQAVNNENTIDRSTVAMKAPKPSETNDNKSDTVDEDEEDEDDEDEDIRMEDADDDNDSKVDMEKDTKEVKEEEEEDQNFLSIPQTHEIIIPSYAGWFNLKKIHPIEKQSLPEFFTNRIASKSPQVYIKYRNFMVNSYRLNPNEYISLTAVRRNLCGDSGALFRIHRFLIKWGLINYQIKTEKLPQSIEPPLTGEYSTRHDAPRGLFPFESYKPSVQLPDIAKLKKMMDLDDQSTTLSQYLQKTISKNMEGTNKKRTRDESEKPVGNSEDKSKEKSEEKQEEKTEVHIKKQDNVNSNEPENPSKKRPKILSSIIDEYNGIGNEKKWTKEELKRLLRGIHEYETDWYKIAKHVGNKTPEECILRFLQLPIEDSYLYSDQGTNDIGPLKYAPHLPFSKSENPVLSTIAFLVGLVNPRIVQSMTQRALRQIDEEDAKDWNMKETIDKLNDSNASTTKDDKKDESEAKSKVDKDNKDANNGHNDDCSDNNNDNNGKDTSRDSINDTKTGMPDATSNTKAGSDAKVNDTKDDNSKTDDAKNNGTKNGDTKNSDTKSIDTKNNDEKEFAKPIPPASLQEAASIALGSVGVRSGICTRHEREGLTAIGSQMVAAELTKVRLKLQLLSTIERAAELDRKNLQHQHEQLLVARLGLQAAGQRVVRTLRAVVRDVRDATSSIDTPIASTTTSSATFQLADADARLDAAEQLLIRPAIVSLGTGTSRAADDTGSAATASSAATTTTTASAGPPPVSLAAPQLYHYWSG
ncbi:hypothetical protein TBLA_0J01090 [Henningerozyma blattae CBS 6284]|uniref:SWIRM domain-containing protein n=1 Tax=Henningerozyma blattae (strain ATCC 34711 / CBS 6284 / DSM 70876 / NBRC 10599 / NRRL Y-10934 / UCD 77-7) TaxID=1071380 RepID=I2H9Q5_HENB6|nr:hypothetical protein TBLA_0J01090 [Tetrapisispora blattae CBS 6284]CCH63107.1 hypothetical protein TBLA_0J01090 [Tetrapisispora blattae CBS 6284]